MRTGRVQLTLALALVGLSAAQQQPWWLGLEAPDTAAQPGNALGGVTQAPSDVDASTEDFFSRSSYWPCLCGDGKSCVCVLYYQCVNGVISTNGSGLLEDRINVPPVERCPGVQRCCQEPPDVPSQTEKPPPASEPEPGPVSPVTPPVTPGTTGPAPFPQPPTKSGCGVRRGVSTPRDNSTLFAEFPWMLVILEAQYPGDGKPPIFVFKCGASLVHPQVALTAAHCVKRITPSDLKVRAGEWDLTTDSEPIPHQDRRVTKIIRHPGFEELTLYNDIALLVLDKNFDQADNVEVACLPPPSADFTGLRCLATGWGTPSRETGVIQTTLKKVELPIVSHNTCETELRDTRLGRYFILHKNFICAGGEPNVDTCRGDGGGPLMCPIADDDGRYLQVGIVSWGIGCGGSRTPAVYASLSQLRNWVDQQLQENQFVNIAVPPPSVDDEARIKDPPKWG